MADVKIREISGMFEGPVLPVTVKLGLPILLANFFNYLYNFIDTVFISLIDRNSTALMSGTGIVFPVYFLFIALASGLGIGVSTMVARSIGEKNHAALRHVAQSGFLIATVLSVFALVAGYLFCGDIVRLLAGKEMSAEAIGYGIQFLRYIMPGMALMLFIQVIIGMLQGEGLTKYIAIGMTISTVANIALDPVLIFGLHMGVGGAGLATSISIAIASLYTAYVFPAGKSSIPFSLNILGARRSLLRGIITIGFPQTISMMSLAISVMVLNKLVSGIGQTEMNSWSLVGRVDQLIFVPLFAISSANVTMIGQNFGRRNMRRLLQVSNRNMWASIILITGLALLYMLFAPLIYRAFSGVPAVVDHCALQVRFISLTFAGVASAVIAGSTFQGTGNPLPPLVITIVRTILLPVPLAFLLASGLGWGMQGVFIAMALANLVILPTAWLWSRRHLDGLHFRSVSG